MLTAKFILERFSKDGKLLAKRERPSRSFLFQFIELLYVSHSEITAAAPYNMTDVASVARTVDAQWTASAFNAKSNLRIGGPPGGSASYNPSGKALNNVAYTDQQTIEGDRLGIVVGTGVGAVVPTDVALGTRIVHGDGAGELEYGGCEPIGLTIADPNGEFTLRRYFTNSSGGGITVEEVGIYSLGSDWDGYFVWPFAITRDLTGGVAVANTELLRVTYVIQITV